MIVGFEAKPEVHENQSFVIFVKVGGLSVAIKRQLILQSTK